MEIKRFGLVSPRFRRLITFCRRRGVRLVAPIGTGWGAFRDDEEGKICISVRPYEVEVDSEMGFLFFTHEVGHTLFGIPWRFVERTREWFDSGTRLGLVTVLLDEFAAWAAGFFLLRSLGIPTPENYLSLAVADFCAYLTAWRRARTARGVWCQD